MLHDYHFYLVADLVRQRCPDVVLWYRESGRLGARGNVVLVGAYDWFGLGPAVFVNLHTLESGDPIEVLGEDGKAYRFLVESVQTYDRASAPVAEIMGETPDEKRLTLLTSAGAFDYNNGTYTQVLVVIAQRTKEKAQLPATPVAVASPTPARDCTV